MVKKHYIKSLLFTTALVTSGSMIAMPNANASEITPSIQSSDQQSENTAVLKDVTIEEVYNAVAEGRNISYEEAKKQVLDDARTKYYQNTSDRPRTFAAVSESALEAFVVGATKHLEDWEYIVNYNGAECFIRYGALVEISGSGSFTYISSIVSGTAFVQAGGTGNHNYQPAYLHSTLVDNNRIRIQASGNMESTVSKTLGGSFSAKGFSLSVSGGNTQTWRKVVTLDKQIKLH